MLLGKIFALLLTMELGTILPFGGEEFPLIQQAEFQGGSVAIAPFSSMGVQLWVGGSLYIGGHVRLTYAYANGVSANYNDFLDQWGLNVGMTNGFLDAGYRYSSWPGTSEVYMKAHIKLGEGDTSKVQSEW